MDADGKPGRRWQTAAAVGSFVLGLLMIVNTHPVGDGMWFWYGCLFREHKLLYTDMHLPLQPLFVLLTAWGQRVFGESWLGSKGLAVVQLGVFCWALWLVAGRMAWKDWERGAVLGGSFVLTVTAGYFRFDDYHVTGYCCVVLSLYLLLRLAEEKRPGRALGVCGLLGVLAGLSLANRLNDGAALAAGSGLLVLVLARRMRWVGLGLVLAGAAGTLLAAVLATGDTLRAWRLESMVRAAAIKGGTGNLAMRPFAFVGHHLAVSVFAPESLANGLLAVAAVWLVVAMVRAQGRRRLLFAGTLFFTVLPFGLWQAWGGFADAGIAVYLMFGLFGLAGWALVRLLRGHAGGGEVLVAIPFLLLLAGIVTGGREMLETYPPIAFGLLLLPFCAAPLFARALHRTALAALGCVLMVCGTVSKVEHPYYWSHFNDRTMFTERTWYRHPLYGWMYVETDQLALFEHVCAAAGRDGKPEAMLSITNPYANWFCDVPPWHGYVQTWYDTTSRETIEGLVGELGSAPPAWIVYQRAPDTLEQNELAFGGGKPLAHRQLDSLIIERISSGAWQVAYRQPLNGTDWMVIQTGSQ